MGQISLRLTEQLLKRVDDLARELEIRRSELVRRAIEAYLESGIEAGDRPIDRVRDLIGAAYGGPSDLGQRHRDYLKDLVIDRR